LNVFTECRVTSSEAARSSVETRRREEADAAESLGFDTLSLGLLDAVHRSDDGQPGARLFQAPGPQDSDVLATLTSRLRQLLSSTAIGTLYAPLAVGWHVDHVLCHRALADIQAACNLVWYEDSPYCFLPAFTAARLAQLGLADSDSVLGSPIPGFREVWGRIRRTALPQHTPWPLRGLAAVVIAGFLSRLPRRYPPSRDSRRTSAVVPELGEHFATKLAACARYNSQIREFYRDEASMRAFYVEHSQSVRPGSTYCERYWPLASIAHD
jgi:LmbE family N-acetylglucosaminyl deacetylase